MLGAGGAAWLTAQERRRSTRETLAYAAGGSLWIRDLPDGSPQPLVSGARLGTPRISPSGEWIAYRQGDAACVVACSGGAPRQLGEGAFAWRSGRDELLIEQDSGLSVCGGANRWDGPLRTIPEAGLPVAFSPDGGELVYAVREGELGSLRRARADSAGAAQTLVVRDGDGLIPYAWLGDSIWYWVDPDFSGSQRCDGLELFRIPAGGGASQALGVATLLNEDFLALSPGGGRLALTVGNDRRSWYNKRIALVDRTAGAVRYLTAAGIAAISPAWSPDGSRMAYSAVSEDSADVWGGQPARRVLEGRRIWLAETTGNSPPVRLTADDRFRDEEPRFLADGRHILFCRIERGPRDSTLKSIWLMDDGGGNLTRIAGPLQGDASFEEDGWFGYYGTIDWRAALDYHRGGN